MPISINVCALFNSKRTGTSDEASCTQLELDIERSEERYSVNDTEADCSTQGLIDRDAAIIALRSELTFTSFGRHGGTTEASTSGLTETQLMQKGQWSSTAAMAHYLHDDDEAKQDAPMERIKRRAKLAKQAAVK